MVELRPGCSLKGQRRLRPLERPLHVDTSLAVLVGQLSHEVGEPLDCAAGAFAGGRRQGGVTDANSGAVQHVGPPLYLLDVDLLCINRSDEVVDVRLQFVAVFRVRYGLHRSCEEVPNCCDVGGAGPLFATACAWLP